MQPSTGSTLQWPYQIAPLPANWNAWCKAIHTVYTKDNSTLLINKLGSWSEDALRHWKWVWHIDPNTHALYHNKGQHWTVRYPFCSQRTYLLYHPDGYQTAQCPLPTYPPAMPTLDTVGNQICVMLPIHLMTPATTTPLTMPDDLLEQLCTPPEQWAAPLWHRVHPLAALDRLILAIHTGCPITICSNTSVDAGKYSSCAWIIHAMDDLWHGEGIIPGSKDNIYSG